VLAAVALLRLADQGESYSETNSDFTLGQIHVENLLNELAAGVRSFAPMEFEPLDEQPNQPWHATIEIQDLDSSELKSVTVKVWRIEPVEQTRRQSDPGAPLAFSTRWIRIPPGSVENGMQESPR
jgi:hypothetical protein